MNTEINKELAAKVLEVVDAGLVRGIGNQKPGEMCVEAAVCYALGLPHSDNPPCVGAAVRKFKIRLNDSRWSSNTARAKGMRRVAIAQLGSVNIDQNQFREIVVRETIKQIVPMALRAAAKKYPAHAEKLEAAAKRCEQDGDRAAAQFAWQIAYAAAAAADAAAAYAAAAYAAAAAADAAYAAAAAADAAAVAADAAADADDSSAADKILEAAAEIAVQALIELKSPGCEFLYLCD